MKKNGQIEEFSPEDHEKVAEALEYAVDHGMSVTDMFLAQFPKL